MIHDKRSMRVVCFLIMEPGIHIFQISGLPVGSQGKAGG